MADTGRTVWASGFWADGFWATGFWSTSDAPVVTETPGSGGIWYEFELIRERSRRRKLKEKVREKDVEQLEETDQQIAKFLYEQEAKDEDREDLGRLQALADRFSRKGEDVPRPILASVMKAHEERSRNALEQMRREMERMLNEEEEAIVALLLMDD